MSIHVAILRSPYPDLILRGRKTVESRLYRTRRPPVGVVKRGERLFIKESGGGWAATAVAGEVVEHEGLDPAGMRALRDRWDGEVLGGRAYWESKVQSTYAVLVRLTAVEPLEVGPVYPRSGYRAWHVLDENLSPLMEALLTDGGVRNGYVNLPRVSRRLAEGEDFVLMMPDGEEVRTQMAAGVTAGGGGRVRWRGWRRYFAEAGVGGGDVLRLVAQPMAGEGTEAGLRRFQVSFSSPGEPRTNEAVASSLL